MPERSSFEPTIPQLEAPEASRSTLLAIIALGIGFDLTFNGQRPGLAVPIFAVILAASLRTLTRRSLETDALLAGAVIVSLFPALRASQPLAVVDVLAASALLALAATQDLGRLTSVSILDLTRRGLAVLQRALHVPRFAYAPLARPAGLRGLRATLRVIVLVVPVLALFAALLASGDQVFARLLNSVLPEWNVASIVSHGAITITGAVLVAILWRTALGDAQRIEGERRPAGRTILKPLEWMTTLAGIDLLFAVFVIVQLAYLFGGDRRVQVTPGLTYAEYARSGFFQLSAAAALTVLVILAAWDAGRRDDARHERWFRGLVSAMAALTGVVLASALTRLALYEGAFGFTTRRFFGYVAIASIGGVLLVLLAAIWLDRRERAVAGFLLVGIVALLAINALNPDRFVAERNLARFEATGRIDAPYLGYGLGPDAIPVATAILGRLSEENQPVLLEALCRRALDLGPEPSWRSINLGRAAARSALETAGITPETCANAAR